MILLGGLVIRAVTATALSSGFELQDSRLELSWLGVWGGFFFVNLNLNRFYTSERTLITSRYCFFCS